MIVVFFIIYIVALTLLLGHLLYQSYLRKLKWKEWQEAKVRSVEDVSFDFNYRIKFITFLFLAVIHFNFYLKYEKDLGYFIAAIILLGIAVLLLFESFNKFMICEKGLLFPNCAVAWHDIVGYDWEDKHNKQIEKLIVTAKKRPAVFFMEEWDLQIHINIKNKDYINQLLEKNVITVHYDMR
ncbi:DUF5673 domain-containing protein [Fusibacter ferrireducens]|uniref:DUF5673 domain-containing protein n=1 Tax=Fusibacter ferrireducens TaxID=2785058 RepID=A0ABR9ZTI5_9FIRM|nr:DUF5673 domain-containing protein [Fusibacter ferrireducens]MBF4693758.1 hypothetical protein [Fusibacter ferrireducens]